MTNDMLHDDRVLADGRGAPPFASGHTVRVLVADARPLVRDALCDLIERLHPLMVVVGEAGSHARALQLARCLRPDVVLLSASDDELELPGTVRSLAALGATRVLLLKGQDDPASTEDLLRLGAAGVVIAEEPIEAIVRAILGAHRQRAGLRAPPQRDVQSVLTLRERELVKVIVAHPSAKYLAIADQMGISEHTVHNHLTRIYQKLRVVNRSDLLAYAVGQGWGGRLGLPGS